MTVHIWTGRPPSGYEAEILAYLHASLEPLETPYSLLANVMVGHRELDLVAIKPDGIFLIEHKWCDAPLIGGINGSWHVRDTDSEQHEINAGRENPYQQLLFNYYALSNWLEREKQHFLRSGRANHVCFRRRRDTKSPKPMAVHNLLVISPRYHQAASRIQVDWRIQVLGAATLCDHLISHTTPRTDLNMDEMTGIARELWLSPWRPECSPAKGVPTPANAAEILRSHLLAVQAGSLAPPSFRQAVRECWDYLWWTLKARSVVVKPSHLAPNSPRIFNPNKSVSHSPARHPLSQSGG